MLWSEPIFLVLIFSGIYALIRYFDNKQLIYLLVSALMMGAALLTRYAAIPFILTSIYLVSKQKYQNKIPTEFLLFTLIAAIIPLTILISIKPPFNDTTRELAFHVISLSHIKYAIITLSNWLIPALLSDRIKIALSVLITIVFLKTVFKEKNVKENISPVSHALISFGITYILFLIAAISFFDYYIALDSRILSPIYIIAVILTLSHPRTQIFIKKYLIIIIVLTLITALYTVIDIRINGQWCNGRRWIESPLIERMKSIPEKTTIYSNKPDIIYACTKRQANMLPRKYNPYSQKINTDYLKELKEIGEKNNIRIVYFTIEPREYIISEQELIDNISIHIEETTKDGKIYSIK